MFMGDEVLTMYNNGFNILYSFSSILQTHISQYK